MQHSLTRALCLAAVFLTTGLVEADDRQPTINACVQCHAARQTGFNAAHAFAAEHCSTCHGGDATSGRKQAAHSDLIAFPGELATSGRACGGCHADRVAGVVNNLMHTGRGMVHITRQLFDAASGDIGQKSLQSLGHGVADSMLRKLCASCHIGQPRTKHALDVSRDRGGGCLACHINEHPEQAHPALTTRVEDGRCFGCHSRSGRISLNYTGLAETDPAAESSGAPSLRLADGRPVQRLPADAHYLAGMSCIDCHTSVGLMGDAGDARHQREAVDIGCSDCHDNSSSRIALSDWPAELSSMKKHVPFAASPETRFLATDSKGTPLWNVELRDGAAVLHTKNTGRRLQIPRADPAHVGHDQQHQRLTCAACHSQWAPQCFGCHMEFDSDLEQWDHVERAVTPGRWQEKRWGVQNGLPPLGINASGRVDVFVPGMIMTVAHPSEEGDTFVRMFAPLSPHTTGPARSCESCHRSTVALGLGEGRLQDINGELRFEPEKELLQDGLAADAWTNLDNSLGGRTPFPEQRALSAAEMRAIMNANIPPRVAIPSR